MRDLCATTHRRGAHRDWALGRPVTEQRHNRAMPLHSAPLFSRDALAAIDMGSNSFRLEIGTVRDGRYKRLQYIKETVRLGAGLDAQGHLTEAAMQRGLACLQQFAHALQGMPAARVRAVATQTLREARNRNAFLARAQEALGYPIEVISGREEARLIYAGVAFLQPSNRRRLVVDIGGRSTEMILGAGRTPTTAESFGIGSVSLSMRYFADGRFTPEAFRAAQIAAGAELEEALAPFNPRRWDEALGSSGTAGAVSEVLEACGVTDGCITPESLRWLIERCLEAGHVDALDLPGLKPDRRAVIGGGLCILYTLATHFGITAMQPAKGALRQGVIIDLHERLRALRQPEAEDLRDHAVSALLQRFGADAAQAQRVRGVALALFDQACPKADAERRHELRWAADLHEIGMTVSHHDHHRHSAYIVAHADVAGFSQSQQLQLSQLILGQRGGLRKLGALVDDPLRALQVMCLRLAVIKCHARGEVTEKALRLRARGATAELSYSTAWADSHPRTVHLLHEEAAAWARERVLQLNLP